jgi:hypothetical protein
MYNVACMTLIRDFLDLAMLIMPLVPHDMNFGIQNSTVPSSRGRHHTAMQPDLLQAY